MDEQNKNNVDTNQDRQRIDANQLQANSQIFTGEWEEVNGIPVRPKANIKQIEPINLDELKALALDSDDEELGEDSLRKHKNLNKLIIFLQGFPNRFLFWSKANICDILERIDDDDLNYWLNAQNIWSTLLIQQYDDKDLIGDSAAYTVAKLNNLICISMITDKLDGGRVNWNDMSQQFSKGASGVVYFLTGQQDTEKWKDSIWYDFELPTLMQNEKVDMIIELDLSNPEKINAVIIKNGLSTAKKYGFKLPNNFDNLKNNNEFKGMFRLQFGDDGIKYSRMKIKYLNPEYVPNCNIEFEETIRISEITTKKTPEIQPDMQPGM